MDISPFIKNKEEELRRYADEIKCISIEWQAAIPIDCGSLGPINDKFFTKSYPSLKDGRKNPGIYYFKIVSDVTGELIVNTLQEFKSQKSRSLPLIDGKRSTISDCLYCGSKKDDIHGRFIAHLGYGSSSYFALGLHHWAKSIGLKLEFHYAFLRPDQKHLTELIESALATAVKPLVGKIQK